MFARHDGATWAYYLVKISEVEEWTVWTNLRKLFLENFSSEAHTSRGTWPLAYISISDRHHLQSLSLP